MSVSESDFKKLIRRIDAMEERLKQIPIPKPSKKRKAKAKEKASVYDTRDVRTLGEE